MDCTVADNSGSYTGGIYGDTYSGSGGTANLTDCILYGDAGGELFGSVIAVYSDIQGGYVGLGNINADPLFVNPGSNFHLQRLPLPRRGNPNRRTTDKDGKTRANPPTMGAYEGTSIPGATHIAWTNTDGRLSLWNYSTSTGGSYADHLWPVHQLVGQSHRRRAGRIDAGAVGQCQWRDEFVEPGQHHRRIHAIHLRALCSLDGDCHQRRPRQHDPYCLEQHRRATILVELQHKHRRLYADHLWVVYKLVGQSHRGWAGRQDAGAVGQCRWRR